MIKLTKDMFSCWGNGDKYDDELIIEHDPKIESKTIANQILENQKLLEFIEQFRYDLENYLEDELMRGAVLARIEKILEDIKK